MSSRIDPKSEGTPSMNIKVTNEDLQRYYNSVFPYDLLHSWLCYDCSNVHQPRDTPTSTSNALANNNSNNNNSNNRLFSHREFSFTIEKYPGGDEIYIRYQSFQTKAELQDAIQRKCPTKIDLGAIFTHPPKDHKSLQGSTLSFRQFRPQQRELVFDIDLTDYDSVRNCGCAEANICTKCWKMMSMAMKVMDLALREDFGFKHIAWFYSGRRGVHAWVCDQSARELSDEARSAVASYFELHLGSDKNQNINLRKPLHPHLERSVQLLEPMFIKDIISKEGHAILSSYEHCEKLLNTLPSCADTVKIQLLEQFKIDDTTTTPAEKWEEIKRYVKIFLKDDTSKASKRSKKLSTEEMEQIETWTYLTILKYTYPRLDVNVSKMQNHLLKSPFCIHPKTGRVCVPIDIKEVDSFDPFAVPTVSMILNELDSTSTKNESSQNKVEFEWEKTSLKKSFQHFRNDFLTPMWKDMWRVQKSKAEEKAALMGDF
jgi:DNA primase small subunit